MANPFNVAVCQGQVHAKHGAKFKTPVVYYSILMAMAYGRSGKDAGLGGQRVPAEQLEALAAKRQKDLTGVPSPPRAGFFVPSGHHAQVGRARNCLDAPRA